MRLITALIREPLGLAAALWSAVVVARWGVEQDPIALANRKFAAGRVVDRRGADWLSELFAAQRRQNVVAIFGCVVGQLRAEYCCNRRQQIYVANRFGAGRAGRYLPGPAGDEGHAMTAFPEVALAAAELAHAGMAVFL